MTWLLVQKSATTLANKVSLYKAIPKLPTLQRYQSQILRQIVNAPFYISNANIHKHLGIPCVKEEIAKHIKKYIDRLRTHENNLALSLVNNNNNVRRLKRFNVLDLPDRF